MCESVTRKSVKSKEGGLKEGEEKTIEEKGERKGGLRMNGFDQEQEVKGMREERRGERGTRKRRRQDVE